jgi:hypothetical protein
MRRIVALVIGCALVGTATAAVADEPAPPPPPVIGPSPGSKPVFVVSGNHTAYADVRMRKPFTLAIFPRISTAGHYAGFVLQKRKTGAVLYYSVDLPDAHMGMTGTHSGASARSPFTKTIAPLSASSAGVSAGPTAFPGAKFPKGRYRVTLVTDGRTTITADGSGVAAPKRLRPQHKSAVSAGYSSGLTPVSAVGLVDVPLTVGRKLQMALAIGYAESTGASVDYGNICITTSPLCEVGGQRGFVDTYPYFGRIVSVYMTEYDGGLAAGAYDAMFEKTGAGVQTRTGEFGLAVQ